MRMLIIGLIGLAGCETTPQQPQMTFDQYIYQNCVQMLGSQPGTPQYEQCKMQVWQNVQQQRNMLFQYMLNMPPPRPAYSPPAPAYRAPTQTNCNTDSSGFTNCTTY